MTKGTILRLVLFSVCLGVYFNHALVSFLYRSGIRTATGTAAVIAAHQDREYHFSVSHPLVKPRQVRIIYRLSSQEGFYVVQSRLIIRDIHINHAQLVMAMGLLPADPRLQQALDIIKASRQRSINATLEMTYDDKVRLADVKGTFNILGIKGSLHARADHRGLHTTATIPEMGLVEEQLLDGFDLDNVHGALLLLPAGLDSGQRFRMKPWQNHVEVEIGPERAMNAGVHDLILHQSAVTRERQEELLLRHDQQGVVYEAEIVRQPVTIVLDRINNLAGEVLWRRDSMIKQTGPP